MCMAMSRRLQLLLDEERYNRVAAAAAAQRVSVATVIRDAIDASLPQSGRGRAAAGALLLEAEPMDVPEPEDLRDELDHLRAHRS
jgi:hypothetical protein